MNPTSQVQNVLLVLPGPLGDAILCGPALRSLRQSLGNSKITFLANHAVREILTDCPWADATVQYDPSSKKNGVWSQARRLRRHDFDAAVLLSNSFRSALMVYLAGIKRRIGYCRDGRGFLLTDRVEPLRLHGRYAPISMLDYYGHLIEKTIGFLDGEHRQADRRLELFTNEDARRRVDELLTHWQLARDQNLVVLVPGGSFGPGKWWPTERFAELADKLTQNDNCRVIISCAPNDTEQEIVRRIAAAAEHTVFDLSEVNLSLAVLKELVRRCRLMISNDTGPCHIAAAFNVPLVTIFGPTDPRWTATGYDREIRLRIDLDCGPCQQPLCPQKHHRCMQEITVAQVYAAARKLLKERGNLNQHLFRKPAPLTGTYYRPFDEQFTPSPDGGGLIHRDYLTILKKARLLDCPSVFAYNRGELLDKPGLDNRERLRLELPANEEKTIVLYLKRFGCPGLGALIKRRLIRRRRSAAAVYDFAAAMKLAEHGIPTARPVAYGQQVNRLGEKRSFVMIEELPSADALERLLPQRSAKQKDYALLRHKKQLIEQIAALVRRLHGAGFYHRDLYLSHIFLSKDKNGCERLNLIDLQRIFRPLLNRRRWQVKDLAQLYYSARDYFSRPDIMRFLHGYLSRPRLSPRDKQLVRAVYRKARRIARHDQKRINKP